MRCRASDDATGSFYSRTGARHTVKIRQPQKFDDPLGSRANPRTPRRGTHLSGKPEGMLFRIMRIFSGA
jgi:hypothetical protein